MVTIVSESSGKEQAGRTIECGSDAPGIVCDGELSPLEGMPTIHRESMQRSKESSIHVEVGTSCSDSGSSS